jgi:hybrid cluster-associated redox disulfide protein
MDGFDSTEDAVDRFTAETPIRDVLTGHPEAIGVFESHGLGCSSCIAADMETLASVATMHDISLEVLLDDLNALLGEEDA